MNVNSAYIHLLGCCLSLILSVSPSLNQTPNPSFVYTFDDEGLDWISDFEMVDNYNYWSVQNQRIEYKSNQASTGSINVNTEEIKHYDKEGTLTLNVETGLCGDPAKDKHSYWGFAINNHNSDTSILAVIDNNGSASIIDHQSMRPISQTAEDYEFDLSKEKSVKLELEVWNAPEGKLIFFRVLDTNTNKLISKNELSISDEKLDGELNIALVANLGVDSHAGVWFDNWEIYKDWVPFD